MNGKSILLFKFPLLQFILKMGILALLSASKDTALTFNHAI